MRTEILEDVLKLLDHKVQLERRKIILFLDNAPCHTETLQNNLKNIKVIFLPQCTTSLLEPLDPDIIRAFKCKYRKRLLKYVVSRIDEERHINNTRCQHCKSNSLVTACLERCIYRNNN